MALPPSSLNTGLRSCAFAAWLVPNPKAGWAEVGALVEIQFDRRTMKLEITRLEAGCQVQWRVIEPVWPMEGIDQTQVIAWILEPYEVIVSAWKVGHAMMACMPACPINGLCL